MVANSHRTRQVYGNFLIQLVPESVATMTHFKLLSRRLRDMQDCFLVREKCNRWINYSDMSVPEWQFRMTIKLIHPIRRLIDAVRILIHRVSENNRKTETENLISELVGLRACWQLQAGGGMETNFWETPRVRWTNRWVISTISWSPVFTRRFTIEQDRVHNRGEPVVRQIVNHICTNKI